MKVNEDTDKGDIFPEGNEAEKLNEYYNSVEFYQKLNLYEKVFYRLMDEKKHRLDRRIPKFRGDRRA